MSSELKEKIIQAVLENKLPVFLGGVGVVLIVGSILFSVFSPQEASEITFKEASGLAVATSSANIMVDIEGAVENPGVYSLPFGSRLKDGLIMAGGLSVLADREKIAKSMNLASKLIDGAKVYFPKTGDVTSNVNVGNLGSMGNVEGVGTININEASEASLDTLPGIGPVTAQKIIAARPYTVIEELVSKKAVGQSVFDKIKDRITTN